MAIVAWWIAGAMTVILLFVLRKINVQAEELQRNQDEIDYLNNALSVLMPDYPCMSIRSFVPEIYCMKPATHVYAGRNMCEECAQVLIKNGADPLPIRFDFEKQRAIAE